MSYEGFRKVNAMCVHVKYMLVNTLKVFNHKSEFFEFNTGLFFSLRNVGKSSNEKLQYFLYRVTCFYFF